MDIENQIRIFSKSKRDSTMDRYATLPIIRAALGLPQAPNHSLGPTERLPLSSKPSIRSSVILEAEMVAYSERTHAIDGALSCFYSDIQLNECLRRVLEDPWAHPIHLEERPTTHDQVTAPTLDAISRRLELRFRNGGSIQFSVSRGRLFFKVGWYRRRNTPFSARLLRHTAH